MRFLNINFSPLFSSVKSLSEAGLRTIFLSACPVCDQALNLYERHLCTSCTARLSPFQGVLCQKCQIPIPPFYPSKRCTPCRSHTYFFSRAFAVFGFDETIQKILHRIKFQKEHALLHFFKPWIKSLSLTLISSNYDFLIPVPLHIKRENERGFNQAEKLARFVNLTLKLPLNARHLKRTQFTLAQSTLNRPQRMHLLENHFQWKGGSLENKKILLIDDVLTTGATVNACAKTLREKGAKQVDVFVLVRTLLK